MMELMIHDDEDDAYDDNVISTDQDNNDGDNSTAPDHDDGLLHPPHPPTKAQQANHSYLAKVIHTSLKFLANNGDSFYSNTSPNEGCLANILDFFLSNYDPSARQHMNSKN